MKKEQFAIFRILVILMAFSFIFSTCMSVTDERFLGPEEWDIESLDVARNANYDVLYVIKRDNLNSNEIAIAIGFSDYSKNVILEMNKMRSDPQKYAFYNKNKISRRLYNILRNSEPLPPLSFSEALSIAAGEVLDTHWGEPGVSTNALPIIVNRHAGNVYWHMNSVGVKSSAIAHIENVLSGTNNLGFLDPKYNFVGAKAEYCTRMRENLIIVVFTSAVK